MCAFSFDVGKAPYNFHLVLVDLQSGVEQTFNSVEWLSLSLSFFLYDSIYNNLKDFGLKVFSIIASTYICEYTSSL
jgi:hypothetical protein